MSALAGNLSYRVCRFLFGKDKVVSTVRLGFHRGFTSAPLRGVIEKNLGRIYRHSLHRAPTAAEVAAVISEMASIQAETMVAMHSSGDELPTWLASTSVDLLPALEDLRLRGRGVIIASPHYGNHALFDVIATLGIPINMLYLYASSWETKATQNSLIRLWDVGLAAPGLMRALAANEVVLLIDDMDYFPDNRTADFFGEPFHPPRGAARLSLASGAPILPAYAVLKERRWHLVCDEPIWPEKASQEDIETKLLGSMERRIAERPGHWILQRDSWDLPACTAELRGQLRSVRLARSLGQALKSIKGLFRVP